jgi:hypothetical protein
MSYVDVVIFASVPHGLTLQTGGSLASPRRGTLRLDTFTAVIKKAGIASCMCWHVNDVVSTSYMSSVVVTFNTHTLCGCGFKFSSSVPSAALLVRCCVFVVGALFVLGVVPLWPLLCLAPCDQTT